MKDARTDFLYKLSTQIIHENQTIVLENLNVSEMIKNLKSSRAILDLGWRKFRTLLEGKAENTVMISRKLVVENQHPRYRRAAVSMKTNSIFQ
ncbi:MAG: IS200/IS605 family accessory protein TnpB-related protein [Trichodesmium sp. MAG_R04]|nr:IS200/IS605 family accessory protein TnpB-related protein [Trichodesmium sp. MAG_R04]